MKGGVIEPTMVLSSGASRSVDSDKLDPEGFLHPLVLHRFSEYMHHHRYLADGSVRAPDNWQAGMPRGRWMSSLMRHLLLDLWLIRRGFPDKATTPDPVVALCAIMFNVQGLMLEYLLDRDL